MAARSRRRGGEEGRAGRQLLRVVPEGQRRQDRQGHAVHRREGRTACRGGRQGDGRRRNPSFERRFRCRAREVRGAGHGRLLPQRRAGHGVRQARDEGHALVECVLVYRRRPGIGRRRGRGPAQHGAGADPPAGRPAERWRGHVRRQLARRRGLRDGQRRGQALHPRGRAPRHHRRRHPGTAQRRDVAARGLHRHRGRPRRPDRRAGGEGPQLQGRRHRRSGEPDRRAGRCAGRDGGGVQRLRESRRRHADRPGQRAAGHRAVRSRVLRLQAHSHHPLHHGRFVHHH